ncbi:MAG: hypothetical protein U5M23_01275 [Marinagarivorans sp.]|nr:hypothetical protein [Marinagarivorans sp.]
MPASGDGVGTIPVTFYPLADAGSSTAAVGDITPSGTVTAATAYRVRVNNIDSAQFVVSIGDTVAQIVTKMTTAINANINMPVIATDATTKVTVTSKWKGISANGLSVSVVDGSGSGITFATVQPVGGLINPAVDSALAQIGNVWESMIVNCLDPADTTALTAYNTFGEGRYGALVHKPLIVFTGNTAASVATAITVTDARKTDRINSQLVSPGSTDLPLVVAARQVARIASVANNNPPRDYGSQAATLLTAGPDGSQWDYPARDQAVKGGSSTVEVRDGVVNISDVVTMYHPTGDTTPAYRYVVDIVRTQNILFNLALRFENEEWDGAPLIPDDQATVNPSAKRPKDANAVVAALIDVLADNAIISDPAAAKKTIQCEIDGANPKRLNIAFAVQYSGNTNITSIDYNFGFYFGGAQ